LLVSKAGITGAADKALMKQLSGYPQALGMSAGVMLVLALLPGIPMLPFLALGGGAAALAWKARNHKRVTKAAEAAEAAAPGLRRQPRRPPPKSRSPPRSRSTTSRSSSATRCCRWSTAPTAPTA
jgi:flagellar biosynthesis component FlhA